MIVAIGGPPGSGKTTVAQLLSERTGRRLIATGILFREMAAARALTLKEFGRLATRDHSVDKELDHRVLAMAREADAAGEDLVVEGRLAGPLLAREGLRVFSVRLDAPLEVRVIRICEREGADPEEVSADIVERQELERQRYAAIYGIDPTEDRHYDLILDSSNTPPEELVEAILRRMDA